MPMVECLVLCSPIHCNSCCWGGALGFQKHISYYVVCRRWSCMWHKDCMIPMQQTVRSLNRLLIYIWHTADSL
jgi:hypothetical protein